MATIEERRSSDGKISYRVKVRLKGFPVETASFERKTAAKRWAAEKETALRSGRYFKTAEAKRHTLKEAIERYLRDVMPTKRPSSQLTQELQLQWWIERLGALTLADITPALIAEARDDLMKGKTRQQKQRTPTTAARYMAVLSHVFTVAVREWQWSEDNPVRRVSHPKEPRGRVRFLTEEERTRLLDACRESRNPFLYDIVVLAISTGMRKNEIMYLRWEDVDLLRAVVTLQETKNGERRAVPLVGHALELMKARAKLRRLDTTLVFPAPRRANVTPKPIDIQSAWDWAVERAQIEDFRFHDLRHTAASYLLMNGASTAEIAEVLGHKTLQMVKRYSHISTPHASRVVARMNQAIFEGVMSGQQETGE